MPLKPYKRGKIWHYSGTIAGNRLRGSTGTESKATAQRIIAEEEAKAWRGHLDGKESALTFAAAAGLYRQAEKPTRFLDRVEAYFRDTLVKDISAGAIRQAAINLYPSAKGATRNRQVIVPAQAIINHAAEMDLCTPIRVKRFPVEAKTKEPVTLEWVDAFVEHASPHLGALCLFMFGTGARVSEAIDLRWCDVDMNRAEAVIRQTKVNRERIANLPPRLVAALANLESNRNPAEKVFGYSARDTARDSWKAATKRAGIKYLSFHSCRHGFATTLLQAGIDPATVADRGGWSDVALVVRVYGHAMKKKDVTNAIFDTPLPQCGFDSKLSDGKIKGNRQ